MDGEHTKGKKDLPVSLYRSFSNLVAGRNCRAVMLDVNPALLWRSRAVRDLGEKRLILLSFGERLDQQVVGQHGLGELREDFVRNFSVTLPNGLTRESRNLLFADCSVSIPVHFDVCTVNRS